MNKTIEFDGEVIDVLRNGQTLARCIVVPADTPAALDAGDRYKVAMTLVEPEPAQPAPPSWDDAPDWAEWLAQDQMGEWRWYRVRPTLPDSGDVFYWLAKGGSYEVHRPISYVCNPKWRDTLQRRTEPELNRCPRCDGETYVLEGTRRSDWWTVQCRACGATGPIETTRALAIAAHNARENPEIDDCPLCGGEWRTQNTYGILATSWRAVCTGCKFATPTFLSKWKLVAALNRRPD